MLLEIQDVVAGYLKGVDVLRQINLQVNDKEMVCLIGPNGAGKSTVLRTISGLLKPSQGKILFQGKDISGLRPDLILQAGIAHVPHRPRLESAPGISAGGGGQPRRILRTSSRSRTVLA